MLKKIRNQ